MSDSQVKAAEAATTALQRWVAFVHDSLLPATIEDVTGARLAALIDSFQLPLVSAALREHVTQSRDPKLRALHVQLQQVLQHLRAVGEGVRAWNALDLKGEALRLDLLCLHAWLVAVPLPGSAEKHVLHRLQLVASPRFPEAIGALDRIEAALGNGEAGLASVTAAGLVLYVAVKDGASLPSSAQLLLRAIIDMLQALMLSSSLSSSSDGSAFSRATAQLDAWVRALVRALDAAPVVLPPHLIPPAGGGPPGESFIDAPSESDGDSDDDAAGDGGGEERKEDPFGGFVAPVVSQAAEQEAPPQQDDEEMEAIQRSLDDFAGPIASAAPAAPAAPIDPFFGAAPAAAPAAPAAASAAPAAASASPFSSAPPPFSASASAPPPPQPSQASYDFAALGPRGPPAVEARSRVELRKPAAAAGKIAAKAPTPPTVTTSRVSSRGPVQSAPPSAPGAVALSIKKGKSQQSVQPPAAAAAAQMDFLPVSLATSASASASVRPSAPVSHRAVERVHRKESPRRVPASASVQMEEQQQQKQLQPQQRKRAVKEDLDESLPPAGLSELVPAESARSRFSVSARPSRPAAAPGDAGGGGRDLDEGLPPYLSERSIRDIMATNIAPVLQRGERLEDLVAKTEDLEEHAFKFHKQATKRGGFFRNLFRRDPAKKEKKKKEKTKIDTILADLENVFNGLSALLHRVTDSPRPGVSSRVLDLLWALVVLLPVLVLTYTGVSLFVLAILLPAVFLLLVLRTQHVERKVEAFVQRQEVLMQETTKEKSVRFVSLVLRALPMLCFLVGWPILTMYHLIPTYGLSLDGTGGYAHVDTACVGIFLVVLVIMQILGTMRSFKSFHEKMKAQHETKVARFLETPLGAALVKEQQEKLRKDVESISRSAAIVPIRPSSSDDFGGVESDSAEVAPKSIPSAALPAVFWSEYLRPPPKFRWTNLRNLIAVLSILVEAVQLCLFSAQTLDSAAMSNSDDTSSSGSSTPPDTSDDSDSGGGGSIGPNFLPYLYVNAAGFLQDHIVEVYAYVAFAVVAVLLLVFVLQLLRELLAYGRAPRGSKEANEIFFHSFIGSIVYGHGEVRHVSSLVSNLVALLADTLFLVVCGKLLAVLTCHAADPSRGLPARLLLDERVVCWQGAHQWQSCVALIAFAYYLPLSSMIGPMLVEADDGSDEVSAPDGESLTVARKVGKKDIGFVQPFLSLLVVSKCALLVVSGFFGENEPVVTVVASLVVSVILLTVALLWLHRSSSASLRSEQWYTNQSFLRHPFFFVAPPCAPDAVNIVRLLSFVGAILGALVALLAYCAPSSIGGDAKYAVLLAIMITLAVIGALWQRHSKVPYGKMLLAFGDDTARIGGGAAVGAGASSSGAAAAGASPAIEMQPVLLHGPELGETAPADEAGDKLTLLSPALMHSSSQEGSVDDAQPSAAAASSRVSTTVRSTSASVFDAMSAPILVSISALQGLELIDGVWALARAR